MWFYEMMAVVVALATLFLIYWLLRWFAMGIKATRRSLRKAAGRPTEIVSPFADWKQACSEAREDAYHAYLRNCLIELGYYTEEELPKGTDITDKHLGAFSLDYCGELDHHKVDCVLFLFYCEKISVKRIPLRFKAR